MSTSSEGRPGKYQRSAGGLVAALIVTVVAVGGLLWVLGLFRPDTNIRPEAIDYLAIAGEAQDAKLDPVYPASLPEGWIATKFEVAPGTEPALEIALFTDDDEFVGIQQESAPASELVSEYVDEDATTIDIYSVQGSVAEAWQGYEDEGGDTAYAAEVGDRTVLVYGSASPEELQDLIGRLTTEPVSD
jgi:hypothetical protein